MALSLQDSVQEGVISAYQSYAASAVKTLKRDLFGRTAYKPTVTGPAKSSITMIVEAGVSGTTQQSVTYKTPNGAGSQPRPTAVPLSGDHVLAQLTFDVWAGSDGFMQSTNESLSARESVHQTAAGFYVDQFNISPGKLSISLIVVGGTILDLKTRIKRFMDALRLAKQSASPLQPSAAPLTRYINTVDGRSLLLTQTDLSIAESADLPNQFKVNISGTILVDYDYPLQVTLPTRRKATAETTAIKLSDINGLYAADALNTNVAAGTYAIASHRVSLL